MRFMVQYIPLSKIRPDAKANITQHIRNIRKLMWDCMHLLAVRRNRKDGSYVVISGLDRYEYLRKHTNKKYAPCIVDESRVSAGVKTLLFGVGSRLLQQYPAMPRDGIRPASLSILRSFVKEEPRFSRLSRPQQIKVILMALRYKKTVVASMKSKVDQMLSP